MIVDSTLPTPHLGPSASLGRKPAQKSHQQPLSASWPKQEPCDHWWETHGALLRWGRSSIGCQQSLAARSLRSNEGGGAKAAGRSFLLSSCFCFISARGSALRNILSNILIFKETRGPCSPVRIMYYNVSVSTLPPFATQDPVSEPPSSGCVNSLDVETAFFSEAALSWRHLS